MSLKARCTHNNTRFLYSRDALLQERQKTFTVQELQYCIDAYLPISTLAQLVSDNPLRAQSELKSVALQVFEEPGWVDLPLQQKEALVQELMDVVFGFGPLESMLDDPGITEIMVNGPFTIFYERDGVIRKSNQRFSDEAQLRALIDRMLGPIGRRVDEASPMVNARLAAGHRVHAVIPPISLDGSTLTIRKFPEKVMTLEDMVASGSIDSSIYEVLARLVNKKKSIAVSGGTGSGKTTLLNALSCKIDKAERIITIEDSAELRFLEHPHVVRLEARPESAEGSGAVSIRELVINALRMRPDRIIVGECRSAEALDMLQAMNTGHDGSLTTLHSNSPEEAVSRLTTMVRYGVDLPVDVIEQNIASAFDVVIQTVRTIEGKRFLSEIAVFLFNEQLRRCEVETCYKRNSFEEEGVWLHPVSVVFDKTKARDKEVQ